MNNFNFPKRKSKPSVILIKENKESADVETKNIFKSVKFQSPEKEGNTENNGIDHTDITECKSVNERCLLECVRVQCITAGNKNEPWKKRSSALLKSFWSEFQKVRTYGIAYTVMTCNCMMRYNYML